MTSLTAGLALRWVDLYTRGVVADLAERRRAEIESDLWEQQDEARRAGTPRWLVAWSIGRRVVAGMAADVTWAYGQRSGPASIPIARPGRMVGALLLAGFYVWVAVGNLRMPGQPYTGGTALALSGALLLVAGAVLTFRTPTLAAVLVALGTAPGLLCWWAVGVPAIAALALADAIGQLADLTIVRGGRVVAAAAVAVWSSPRPGSFSSAGATTGR